MKVPDRVQIVPLGYEYERVLKPINDLKADRVILLRHLSEEDYEADFQRELIEKLRDNDRIELEIRECDIFSLQDSQAAIRQAVANCDQDDEIFINLATGSKLTAIGGMVICQSTDATPFYVKPRFTTQGATHLLEEQRAESADVDALLGESQAPPQQPIVAEAGEIEKVPVFRLNLPTTEQLQILDFLANNERVTKKDLIRFSESNDLPFIAETTSQSDEGKYRLLETHIIDPLLEDGYINVEKAGRKKHVELTDRGEDVLNVAVVRP